VFHSLVGTGEWMFIVEGDLSASEMAAASVAA
jgi:hypothetical protein